MPIELKPTQGKKWATAFSAMLINSPASECNNTSVMPNDDKVFFHAGALS